MPDRTAHNQTRRDQTKLARRDDGLLVPVETYSWGAVSWAVCDEGHYDGTAWIAAPGVPVKSAEVAARRPRYRDLSISYMGVDASYLAVMTAVIPFILFVIGSNTMGPVVGHLPMLVSSTILWALTYFGARHYLSSPVEGVTGPIPVDETVRELAGLELGQPAASGVLAPLVRLYAAHPELADLILQNANELVYLWEAAQRITGPSRTDIETVLLELVNNCTTPDDLTATLRALPSVERTMRDVLRAEAERDAEITRPIREAAVLDSQQRATAAVDRAKSVVDKLRPITSIDVAATREATRRLSDPTP